MKKILLLLLFLFLLPACSVKKTFKLNKKKNKEQREELLKEEKIKKIQFIKDFYADEISDLNLFAVPAVASSEGWESGKINQQQLFDKLKKVILEKKNLKELQNSSFSSFFQSKETPFNNYRDFLEDNIRFLYLTKPYFYLQDQSTQKEIQSLLKNLINLQKMVIVIPELSYEK